MTTSMTIALNGNTSVLSEHFFPQIELNRNYECALIDFYTFNSIPNVDEGNNIFQVGDKVIEIPMGSYEFDDITKYIINKLKEFDLHNSIKIECNTNTLQVQVITKNQTIYFNHERSIGKLFGFNKRKLRPHENEIYISDSPVNILKINSIRLECNIISGSYVGNKPNHVLHEFGINVPPGYKMNITPRNLIYLPVNTREISTLQIRITDQNGDLINLRGETVSIRLHLRATE